MGHSREGSLIFLLSQFPSVVVTGHVLRELKQVSADCECPSRPWRARAKSDLQLGGPGSSPALPPACQGALALSGVLRRLQQVEDRILQVKALLRAPPLPVFGGAFLPSPPPSAHSGLLLFLFTPCPLRPTETSLPLPPKPPTSLLALTVSVTVSFSFLFLTWPAEEGSELGQQGISQKEH